MILVTGGNGFLGKALMRRVETAGRQAVSYDLPEHTIIENDKWSPGARYELDDHVAKADVVIHSAAVADLNESALDAEKNDRINIEGTRNVAQACARHGKLMVYISTCCAYGNAGRDGSVVTEETTPEPTELYARSKLEGEKICEATKGLRYRTCRIATLYGPGMRPALFSCIALDKCLAGETIEVHGDGKQTRTYGYIDDVVEGIIAVLDKGSDGEIYNVAGDGETSVLDTIRIAGELVGVEPKVEHVTDREGQIFGEVISSDKLKKLGWSPKVGYEEGMKLSLEWLRSMRSK